MLKYFMLLFLILLSSCKNKCGREKTYKELQEIIRHQLPNNYSYYFDIVKGDEFLYIKHSLDSNALNELHKVYNFTEQRIKPTCFEINGIINTKCGSWWITNKNEYRVFLQTKRRTEGVTYQDGFYAKSEEIAIEYVTENNYILYGYYLILI